MKNGDQWYYTCPVPHAVPTRSLTQVMAMEHMLTGEWKEETDTQEISWEYFRSIVDAQMYSKMLKPWRME